MQREERPLSLQAVSGKGQQDPGLCCQDSGLPRDGSTCFFSDSFFFKNSLFTCGTNYLETRDGLTAVRQLSTSVFFVLFFQQQKVFSAFDAKLSNTYVWVYAKCNAYSLFSKASAFEFERKLASWSLVLLLVYSLHPLLTFVAQSRYTCSKDISALLNHKSLCIAG